MTDVDREPGHQQWTVTSGIGANTGVPFVTIVTPTGAMHQCSADEAEALADNLRSGAEAARFDLAFFRAMTEDFAMTPREVAAMLLAIRTHRDDPPSGPLVHGGDA
jgi:hypothetical protein